ncbi:PA14 domain-containing protein [Streptomyces sp. NPDC049585]|uniref:PA14 domain-containing protein n=1 Tax=Streptomyces sp. NPDC049585 TaxID=3155154 RepID=UPI0034345683
MVVTLLGGRPPVAVAAGPDATGVALLPAAAGAPVRPEWPAGRFVAPAAAPGASAPAAPRPAGPQDGAVLAQPRPELKLGRAADAAAYEFVLSTGDRPGVGQTTSSGWLTTPSWRAPAGLLADGGRYTWAARVRDGRGRVGAFGPASAFTVNRRLGAPAGAATAPADAIGPVSVDTATGNVSVSVSTPQTNTAAGPLGATFRYDSLAVDTSGLTGAYFAGDSASGIAAAERPAAVRTDARPDFAWGAAAPYPDARPGGAFRVRWTGRLRVPEAGTYQLGAAYGGGLRVWIDGRPVLDDWQGPGTATGHPVFGKGIRLRADRAYEVRVEHRRPEAGGEVALWARGTGHEVPVPASWLAPSGAVLPPGWSVTPAAQGTAGAANGATGAANGPATGSATGRAAPGAPLPPVSAPAAASARPARSAAARGVRAQIEAAENGGVRFSYAGSPECADRSAPAGFVCAVSVPGAGRTTLSYREGKLARITNPGAEVTDFGFLADHRLTDVRPPLVSDWIGVDPRHRDTEAARYRIGYTGNTAAAAWLMGPEPTGAAAVPSLRPRHEYAYTADATEIRVAGVATAQGWARRLTHDAAGRVLSDTDGTGRTVRTEWTGDDRQASVTDAAGRMTTTVHDAATGAPAGTYGPGPRACFGPDRRPLTPPPAGCEKVAAYTTTYGPGGITAVRADSDGVPEQTTLTRLDEHGLPVATVTDPGGLALRTGQAFDELLRPTVKELPSGARQVTTYFGPEESADNPCTERSDPAPQRGLWKTVTLPTPADGSGRVNKNVYNARGVPVAQNTGQDGWICLKYDERGRTVQMRMPRTPALPERTVDYDYAYRGDPLTLRGAEATDTMVRTVDLLGRQVRFTDAHGTVTTTSYDRAGRAVEERLVPPVATDGVRVKRTRHDAAGRVTDVSLNGSTLAVAAYDAAGGLASVRYGNGTALAVSRDAAGRITGKQWTLADGHRLDTTVTRSRSGTITEEHTPGPDGREERSGFRYDAAGRLVEASVAGHVYGYDFTSPAPADCPRGSRADAGANSNRVRLTDRTASGTAVTGYCYDDDDRLLATTGARQLTGFAYAPNGNLAGYTDNGAKVTRRYDFTERYLGGTAGGTEVFHLQGLADGLIRRDVTTAGHTETYLYGHSAYTDTEHDLVLRSDKRLLTWTVPLPGGVLHMAAGAAYGGHGTYSHPTVRGNVFLVTGEDGRRKGDLYRYGPFGEPFAADGTVDPDHVPDNQPGDFDYGWLGQYRRGYEHSGPFAAVVLDLRTLNPAFGRFEVGFTQGEFLNAYEYVYGDPVDRLSLNGVVQATGSE